MDSSISNSKTNRTDKSNDDKASTMDFEKVKEVIFGGVTSGAILPVVDLKRLSLKDARISNPSVKGGVGEESGSVYAHLPPSPTPPLKEERRKEKAKRKEKEKVKVPGRSTSRKPHTHSSPTSGGSEKKGEEKVSSSSKKKADKVEGSTYAMAVAGSGAQPEASHAKKRNIDTFPFANPPQLGPGMVKLPSESELRAKIAPLTDSDVEEGIRAQTREIMYVAGASGHLKTNFVRFLRVAARDIHARTDEIAGRRSRSSSRAGGKADREEDLENRYRAMKARAEYLEEEVEALKKKLRRAPKVRGGEAEGAGLAASRTAAN